jgi:hypothetical protein
MNKKHQYVLENLLLSHPNNTGLQNAHNRSLELEDKFELKTERKIERMQTSEGRHILREIKKEKEDNKEDEKKDDRKDSQELQIKAKISGNYSQIKIELKFDTKSTNNATISGDIFNELRLTRDNISNLLRIENESEDSIKESLEADAQIRMNVSKVNVQYQFALNETNRTKIIDGIYEKLSGLTQNEILDVLVINVKQDQEMDNKENILKDMDNRKEITTEKRENKTESEQDRRENKKED